MCRDQPWAPIIQLRTRGQAAVDRKLIFQWGMGADKGTISNSDRNQKGKVRRPKMSEVCWPRRASAEVTSGLGQAREDQGPGIIGYENSENGDLRG